MLFGVIVIIVIFLILAALMITRRMPALLALPVMALSIGLVAGLTASLPWSLPKPEALNLPWRAALLHGAHLAWAAAVFSKGRCLSDFLFLTILTDGSAKLAPAMLYAVFGAILSQVVMRQGIAQRIVRVAAEFAGDRKILLAGLMTGAVALSFLSLTGLGAVIMVGSLALPIMIGGGLSPLYAGSLMLFAISIGGIFNGANMGFYTNMLRLDLSVVRSFAGVNGILLALVAAAFLVIEGRREKKRFAWALIDEAPTKDVPWYALLTPLIPIALIMLPWTLWPIIPSFLAAILYGCITTEARKTIQSLTAAVLEGLKDISPVFGLFVGIGMVLNAMADPVTKEIMFPFVKAITPSSPLPYLAVFTVLAPLSLYRGPLNLYGLGAGLAGLVLSSQVLPAAAVMAAFLAVGQIQGVCDPTNTHNVWLAQFTKLSPEEFLKKTLPYVWVYVLLSLLYSVFIVRVIP